MKRFFSVLCLFWAVNSNGLQIYQSDADKIEPTYKSFTYYISNTYYEFFDDDNIAITQMHIDGIHASLDILTEKAAAIGLNLSFTYGGTYDVATALGPNGDQNYSSMDFDGVLYFDFTSEQLWGRQWVASASADGRTAPGHSKRTGGVVRFNSDFLNWVHPDVNMSSSVIHEILHIFGVDHSTTSSAIMAYTEFWYPTLSADDLMALRQVYELGPDTELNVTVTKSGQAAPGVEVVVIDPVTGSATQVVANTQGIASLKHLPVGNYLVGVRELTPTGPCFEEPTRGFLTTYYHATTATNDVANAGTVNVASGSVSNITIPVIVGTKRFDCHYARATALSDAACNANSFGANTFDESCWLHMAKASSRFTPLIINDLTTYNHSTDTNTESGAHSGLTLTPMGSENGVAAAIRVHSTELVTDLGNHHKIDLDIGISTTPGVKAAYCEDSTGEQALIGSLIEVQDFGSSLTNKHLLPTLAADFSTVRGPRNFGQFLRAADSNPSSGPRPPNDAQAWAAAADAGYGSYGSGSMGSSGGGSKKEEDKKWYQCGTIHGVGTSASMWLMWVLFAAPAVCGATRRRQ